MSTYSTHLHPPTSSLPLSVPKSKDYHHHNPTYYSVSPPETSDSVGSSSDLGGGVSSYTHSHSGYSATSSGYGYASSLSSLSSSSPSSSSGSSSSHSWSRSDGGGGSGSRPSNGPHAINVPEYVQTQFAQAFDPMGLDKAIEQQVQISGHLNAKQRELLELQAQAQARLAKSRARFAEGVQDAREVRTNLEWTEKKVASLTASAAERHPKQYGKAREWYPLPE